MIFVKNNLHNEMSFIDYVHITTNFQSSMLNDKNLSKLPKNQDKNLHNLFLNNSYHNSVTSQGSYIGMSIS